MVSSHEAVIDRQFVVQAHAYVTSAVHAARPELDALVACVGMQPEGRALDFGCGAGRASPSRLPRTWLSWLLSRKITSR